MLPCKLKARALQHILLLSKPTNQGPNVPRTHAATDHCTEQLRVSPAAFDTQASMLWSLKTKHLARQQHVLEASRWLLLVGVVHVRRQPPKNLQGAVETCLTCMAAIPNTASCRQSLTLTHSLPWNASSSMGSPNLPAWAHETAHSAAQHTMA